MLPQNLAILWANLRQFFRLESIACLVLGRVVFFLKTCTSLWQPEYERHSSYYLQVVGHCVEAALLELPATLIALALPTGAVLQPITHAVLSQTAYCILAAAG